MSKELSEDDFERLKFKGGGSFGQVYKARRKDDTKEVCALKYISKRKSPKETRNDRNEIKLLQRLKHPNIVQLLASFETEDDIVLVCEYASTELFKAINGQWFGKYFSEDKARRISCQICSALYFLHARKVLHRDLKPQNILVTKDKIIKLCDFGFARFMGETYFARTILGTPLYMAPELFLDQRYANYTEKVDLWALGCIIYELRKGKPAFKRIVQKHKDMRLPKKFSDDLKDLLSKLLVYDEHRRIPWPQILSHKWFKGGIVVSDADLAEESPYTKPDIGNLKRIESIRVRTVRRFIKRVQHRDFAYGGKKKEERGEKTTCVVTPGEGEAWRGGAWREGREGAAAEDALGVVGDCEEEDTAFGDALGVKGDGEEDNTAVGDALGVVGDGDADFTDEDGEEIDTVIIEIYEDEDEEDASEDDDDSEDEDDLQYDDDGNQSSSSTQD